MSSYENRESWLAAAVEELRPWFKEINVNLPDAIRVACGWSKRSGKGIGWCWKSKASRDGTSEILVSPELEDPIAVLEVLVHELIHASDDGESEHKGEFKVRALAMGLEGKMTATRAGTVLRARLADLKDRLGPYPHAKINPAMAAIKPQTTRMLKLTCPDDGYTVRTTQKWIDVGLPACPCGAQMELATAP